MAESEEELKSLLMKVEGKSWLKTQYSKNKDNGIGLITSWRIDGKRVSDFIFLRSKITVNGDCSHEIKRCLLLGRTAYDKPRQCIKKKRHNFTNKGPSSQSYGFSSSHVWM